MKIKIGRNIIACVLILMVMTPGVLALEPAKPPEPSYMGFSESITVDGDPSDWVDKVVFANMYEAGKQNKDLLAKLYLRYDCESEILYALVLCESDIELKNDPTGIWIKEYSFPKNAIIMGMNGPGEIIYIYDGNKIIGYEAWGKIKPGVYNEFEAHAVTSTGDTSSTGKKKFPISLKIVCDSCDIPEFSTIALPIATILGIMFILQSRRRKED